MSFDKKLLKSLLSSVDLYDDEYYNKNKKSVSDEEYDNLKDQLRTLSKSFQPSNSKADKSLFIRLTDALTRVGAPPPLDGKWVKLEHEVPMGSLNKVNLPDELKSWAVKCKYNGEFFITEKLDGISVSLRYENGNLITAATRGDGSIGENITRNVMKMKGVPHKLTQSFTGHIRGEIVLLHSDWKKHFPKMTSARNAASGISNRIDGDGVKHLTVISYTIDGKDFDTEDQAFEYIKDLGFNIPNYTLGNLDWSISQWYTYMKESRDQLDYDIDGLVIRINDRSEQFSLGEENHRPKGAIAFKFKPPEARTIINNIVCQVGDTGQITPVAEFNPVELLGVNIKRASLHNFSLVKALKINIGAEVLISRRNDVIPYVEKVIKENNGYYNYPENCPSCGALTKKVGEYIICPNKKNCPSQVLGRLNKWINELGILEWGESILKKLIDSGKVVDVADIYKLTENDILNLDRMGDKSAKNLIDELNKYRSIPLENFIGGLCIDGIATSTVKSVISNGYDTLDKILSLSVSDFEKIDGFANKRAVAFYNGLIDNADRIENILNAGVIIKDKVHGSLSGKSFCFTGTMNTPRAKLQKMVTDAGGEVKKTVGKGLNYLVIQDPNATTSKAKAAKKNNTTLLSEQDFLDML